MNIYDENTLIEKILAGLLLVGLVLVLLWGCHLDATYKLKGTVYSVSPTEICFEDKTGELYSCYATETENVKVGDKYILKFDHKGTESDRSDDGLIGYKRIRR